MGYLPVRQGRINRQTGIFFLNLPHPRKIAFYQNFGEAKFPLVSVGAKVIEKGTFRIFPNPASGQVEILFSKNIQVAGAEIRAFDISGKAVFQKGMKGGRAELDLGHLPGGLYLISLQSDRQVLNEKLILQR